MSDDATQHDRWRRHFDEAREWQLKYQPYGGRDDEDYRAAPKEPPAPSTDCLFCGKEDAPVWDKIYHACPACVKESKKDDWKYDKLNREQPWR